MKPANKIKADQAEMVLGFQNVLDSPTPAPFKKAADTN